VLPLANLSNDPAQEYFADGMTEELITNLAPIRSLTVISRTSVMRFKGSKQPLREIADQLGVNGIVEGSVQRAGDRVRITAQLIEAAHDRHLWAKSYERDFRDVLTLQSEVASDIAREIQLQISPQERAKLAHRHLVNPEAFEEYLRGRYEWSKMTDEGALAAIGHFERALKLDPGDARYSSGLADAYLIRVQVMGTLSGKEGMAKVKEYARKALASDEGSAEAHTSMAAALFFGDWDIPGAERHVRRAIELNPGYGTAHLVYSVILLASGRFREAIEQDRLAMQIDPFSLIVHWNAVGSLLAAREFDSALALARQIAVRYPDAPLSQGGLVRVHEVRGEFPAALDIMRQHLPESDGGKALVARAEKAYAASGPRGYYRVCYEFLSAPTRKPPTQAPLLAMLAANMGDLNKAMAHLEQAYAEHNSDLLFINVERCYDPMRKDPRFQALVRRVGLTPRA
jgi:TolB-like protein/Flp pilus assembly protein TadD